MKALTIKQPWATLIAHGIKDIENRTWKTNFRGRILIHVSGSQGKSFKVNLTDEQSIATTKILARECMFGNLPFGAVIGSVEIVNCLQDHPSIWAEKGVWNWVLDNPILFKHPINDIKGCLGLWNITDICQYCGYTENHACYSAEHGSCWWADENKNLCFHCSTEKLRSDKRIRHQIYE